MEGCLRFRLVLGCSFDLPENSALSAAQAGKLAQRYSFVPSRVWQVRLFLL